MIQSLKDIVEMAETWPPYAQEELISIIREMDEAYKGGVYHATPEELAGIERGIADADAGRFATEEEIDELFAKYR